MAKKKRKRPAPLTGQINFYKAMTVLGIIIAGAFIYGFLTSAPPLSNRPYHIATDPAGECMSCHVNKVKSAPIMPHRPMDGCTFCHSPADKN